MVGHLKRYRVFISGFFAGLCVALGASIYLFSWALGLRALGSVLFSVGLIIISIYGLGLYTGKIGYVFAKGGPRPLDLLLTFLGNAVGVVIAGYSLLLLRFAGWTSLFDIVDNIAQSRAVGGGEAWYITLILGFFCGVFVFLAVDIYKKAKNVWLKYLGLVFFVTAFVITGTEHCLANIFFFSLGNAWNGGTLLNVALVILGNSFGGIFIWFMLDSIEKGKQNR